VETLALLDLASNTELHLDRLVNDETEFGAGLCSVYEAGLVMAQIATGKDLGRFLLAQVGHFKYPSQTAEMESYQRLENAAISQVSKHIALFYLDLDTPPSSGFSRLWKLLRGESSIWKCWIAEIPTCILKPPALVRKTKCKCVSSCLHMRERKLLQGADVVATLS
jgi:hypothetical protein